MRRLLAFVAAAALAAATAGCTPAPKLPDDASSAAVFARLQEFSQDMMDEGAPALLIQARNRRTEWTRSLGVRNLDSRQPAQLSDATHVAQLTTSMLAVSVLKLAEEGRIQIDEPVSKYLARFNGIMHPPEPVTVRQLLDHESGMPDYSRTLWSSKPLKDVFASRLAPEDRLALAAKTPWKRKLAQGFEWSNSNNAALVLLLEEVRGRPLAEVLRDDIIRPLGLTGTFMSRPGNPPEELLHGYITIEDERFDAAYPPVYAGSSVGMISTVADVNTFYTALVQGKLLKAETFDQLKGPVFTGFRLGVWSWNDTCTNDFYYGGIGDVQGYGTVALTSADGTRQIAMAPTYPPAPFVADIHPLVLEMAEAAEQTLNRWC
ncbi:serine hydrolase [Arthrobacter sp. ISL-28]|uniref:serine hydrolase domain-containing protein n=1 Tax=Arthrobacter sp. ISL-28 TaxID=2819108 RepID=UPI001BECE67E|nr:serine hydrolase domain-containing protein [Arthrobacter sp. ISL-28]MBT2519527.1 beta-lactamase family protein [Arthrobacter sp. ISL-28]